MKIMNLTDSQIEGEMVKNAINRQLDPIIEAVIKLCDSDDEMIYEMLDGMTDRVKMYKDAHKLAIAGRCD